MGIIVKISTGAHQTRLRHIPEHTFLTRLEMAPSREALPDNNSIMTAYSTTKACPNTARMAMAAMAAVNRSSETCRRGGIRASKILRSSPSREMLALPRIFDRSKLMNVLALWAGGVGLEAAFDHIDTIPSQPSWSLLRMSYLHHFLRPLFIYRIYYGKRRFKVSMNFAKVVSLSVCFLQSYLAGRGWDILDSGRALQVLVVVYTAVRNRAPSHNTMFMLSYMLPQLPQPYLCDQWGKVSKVYSK